MGEAMQKSQHPIDLKIKQNLNVAVKCADLT